MSPSFFCFQSRLRIDKHDKKNPITVAKSEEIVFQSILNIPNHHQQQDQQQQNLKERINTIIDQATLRAEKKTSKDRLHITSLKQDAFINVNSFLGGLLLFGLTGRRSENNPPDRMVLELQILSFFIFLGAIMSNLMFLLFVKFHNWKKYQPYQEALVEIQAKVTSIWRSQSQYDAGNDNFNNDNVRTHYDNEAKAINDGASLSDDWSQYSQYQSLIANTSTKLQDTDSQECDEDYTEFLTWMRRIIDIAARKESNDRERLRKWSILIPFTLTFIGMVILCLVVFLGANVQLHTGREHDRGHLHLWIYIVAPLSLIVPFVTTLYLITYFTGRLHDINS